MFSMQSVFVGPVDEGILDMLADLKRWDVDDYYDPDATTGTVYSRVGCQFKTMTWLWGIKAVPVS